jgi:hypothetical protein
MAGRLYSRIVGYVIAYPLPSLSMPSYGQTLPVVLVASLAACGGSPSASSQPPGTNTTTVPNVSRFYGVYRVNYVPVLDTCRNLTFAQEGTITLSGDPSGSNVTIELLERAVRVYSGVVRPNGSFSGSGSGFTPDTGVVRPNGSFSGSRSGFTPSIFRHTYEGGIQGELQGPPTGITGMESLLFDAGCEGKMVELEITGRP